MADDTLPPPANTLGGFANGGFPDDSGFSSRMSEDSASLHRAVEFAEIKRAVLEVAAADDSVDDDDETHHCADDDETHGA